MVIQNNTIRDISESILRIRVLGKLKNDFSKDLRQKFRKNCE